MLLLDPTPEGIFESLLQGEPGVRIDPPGSADLEDAHPCDLLLEEVRVQGFLPRRASARASLLAPGGRWIAVIQGHPAVGLHGRALLRQARREGFERIETFYAHPALAFPKMLVPLDRIEPIRFFLDFAMGVPTLKKRCLAVGFPVLAKLGIHREVLPNLILTARRRT